jgi:hypothetical protein
MIIHTSKGIHGNIQPIFPLFSSNSYSIYPSYSHRHLYAYSKKQVYQAISEIPEYLTDTEQQEIINSEKDNMDENDKNFKILIKSIYAAKLKQKDQ